MIVLSHIHSKFLFLCYGTFWKFETVFSFFYIFVIFIDLSHSHVKYFKTEIFWFNLVLLVVSDAFRTQCPIFIATLL
uniref:Uncharacterized protein n=1 Tax=Pararge aegeria TaxID=116150 RepID=S4NRE2_9NEOP